MGSSLSTPAPSAKGRLEWLDGLRAIAILGVVTVHTAGLVHDRSPLLQIIAQTGQYGVQLFFVISTITIMKTLEFESNTKFWYIKRFFRIAPLYYIAIVFYYPIFLVENRMGFRSHDGLAANDIIANILFMHGWVPSANNSTVPGGWSIAVEMTFYAFAPAMSKFANKYSKTYALIVFFALAVLISALSIALSHGGPNNNTFLYFWPINQLHIFLLGVGLYRYFGDRLYSEKPHSIFIIFSIFALSLGLYLGPVADKNHTLAPLAVALSGWAAILGLGHFKSILTLKPVVFIGRISFSIYIVHFFFEHVFRFIEKKFPLPSDHLGGFGWFGFWFILMMCCSTIAAFFTYRTIEIPSIAAGGRFIEWLKSHRPPERKQ